MSAIVTDGALVRIAVKMADMTGKVLEETGPEGIWYWQGQDDIFPKIEKILDGHFVGETVFVKLEPEDAFGLYDADDIAIVPIDELGDIDNLEVGMSVTLAGDDDTTAKNYIITDMAQGVAVLDGNHPLAGIALQFELKVLEIKDPEDLESDTPSLVPDFLQVADRLIDEEALEDDTDYEGLASPEPDSPMAKLATPTPRIIR